MQQGISTLSAVMVARPCRLRTVSLQIAAPRLLVTKPEHQQQCACRRFTENLSMDVDKETR